MKSLPHRYNVTATGAPTGTVTLSHAGVPDLPTAPPVEFGGPGDNWSPEGLLTGAVADCFILTFRAVARAAKLEWSKLEVSVEGILDRQEGVTAFTAFNIRAEVTIAAEADSAQAESSLQRAERGCLVSNSLKATMHLETVVHQAG